MRTVAEDATLSVVAGFNEFHNFSRRGDLRAPRAESLQVFLREESGTRVLPDEFFNGVPSVPGDGRKNLFGDGEDASAGLPREAIVEHADFVRAGGVSL